MSYGFSKEYEVTIDGDEKTLEIFCDVEMTHKGYPGDRIDPPEAPEYECGDAYFVFAGRVITFKGPTLEWLLGEAKAEAFFKEAEQQAHENWSD